jgi:hypothetical protein
VARVTCITANVFPAHSLLSLDDADDPFVEQQEMDMEREISLLSDYDLDAVTGGMMNNGVGQHFEVPKNTGGGKPNASEADAVIGGLFTLGLILGIGLG